MSRTDVERQLMRNLETIEGQLIVIEGQMDTLRADNAQLQRERDSLFERVTGLERQYREEYAIVDTVWDALGLNTTQDRAIGQIVADLKQERDSLKKETQLLQRALADTFEERDSARAEVERLNCDLESWKSSLPDCGCEGTTDGIGAGWGCFHCGRIFCEECAAEHFGAEKSKTACQEERDRLAAVNRRLVEACKAAEGYLASRPNSDGLKRVVEQLKSALAGLEEGK